MEPVWNGRDDETVCEIEHFKASGKQENQTKHVRPSSSPTGSVCGPVPSSLAIVPFYTWFIVHDQENKASLFELIVQDDKPLLDYNSGIIVPGSV